MQRIAPHRSGKYDEVIEWLRWLEQALTQWSADLPVPAAVSRLSELHRHEHAVVHDANAFNWSKARENDKRQTMKWIPVYEAATALIGAMEGWQRVPILSWQENIENVKACRRHLEQHNPPVDNPIKY